MHSSSGADGDGIVENHDWVTRVVTTQDIRGVHHETFLHYCCKCKLAIEKHPDDMTGEAWELELREPQCAFRQVRYVMES